MKTQTVKMNRDIREQSVRLIDENGNQLGIMPTNTALNLAAERELDLVEINPGEIPVCKIMDWGKEQYRKKKLKHQQQINSKKQETKELYLRPVTGEHDIQIKVRQAMKFLEQGHKVKIGMKFQGREMAHRDVGQSVMESIIDQFSNRSIEHMPFRNNQIQIIISPTPSKAK
ncbi:MAG: translation initiation factor IF-3 [Gammaproteobacteria bacterium]|nr:translation initiation factor IF-3 [Gammaproteobacteria bacterium]